MSDDPLYIAFRTYLSLAIDLELAALTRRGAPVSVAERDRLSELLFTGKYKGWQRAADSAARTAAQQALGLSWTAEGCVEEILGWKLAASVRKFAEATAPNLLKESNATATRSAAGGLDLREIVKAEVSTHLRTLHRGVWKEGEHYEQGQMTTRDGSVWNCLRDNPQGKPGDSPDWLLIVKHGENARRR